MEVMIKISIQEADFHKKKRGVMLNRLKLIWMFPNDLTRVVVFFYPFEGRMISKPLIVVRIDLILPHD